MVHFSIADPGAVLGCARHAAEWTPARRSARVRQGQRRGRRDDL